MWFSRVIVTGKPTPVSFSDRVQLQLFDSFLELGNQRSDCDVDERRVGHLSVSRQLLPAVILSLLAEAKGLDLA